MEQGVIVFYPTLKLVKWNLCYEPCFCQQLLSPKDIYSK